MSLQQLNLRPIGQGRPNEAPMEVQQGLGAKSNAASLRQMLLPGGSSAGTMNITGMNSSALEHLRRTADRMAEEQENARQDVHTYREKLSEVQAMLARTEQDLARERQENILLRAKAKDDGTQVNYVVDKIKVLTVLQESVRSTLESTGFEMGRVDQFRRDLDFKILGQDRDTDDTSVALQDVTTVQAQLTADLQRVQASAAGLQSQLRQAAEDASRKDAAFDRLMADVALKERAAELHASSLQKSLSAAMADLAASRGHAEQLRADLDAERSRSANVAQQLTDRYQEAQQRIMELDVQLCTICAEHKAAREQILKLEAQAQGLTSDASIARDELASMQLALAECRSELKNAVVEAGQLGHRLEAMQEQLAGRETELQRLEHESAEVNRRIEELTAQEVILREELAGHAAETSRLEEELLAKRDKAALKENEVNELLAAAQAAAAAETTRAAAAVAAAEQRLREAERAGEARLERFKERTSRENDEMRRRVRAEAEAEAKRLAEELKKATAALTAAESLAAQGAAEREAAKEAEIQALRASTSEEIAKLKAQAAEAHRKTRNEAQESKVQYERDLAEARAAAQEAVEELRQRLEGERQQERDEWEREMEALTSAEKADAEERSRQMLETLRVNLEAKAEARLREVAADADQRKRELEAEVEKLNVLVQELQDGTASGDEQLAAVRQSVAQLEQQLSATRQEAAAAREGSIGELKRVREQLEQNRLLLQQRELEWQTHQRRMELERLQADKEAFAKEAQLQLQLRKLESDVHAAQRERELERDQLQRRQCDWKQAQEQLLELEQKKWQLAEEERRQRFERELRAEFEVQRQAVVLREAAAVAAQLQMDCEVKAGADVQPDFVAAVDKMDQDAGAGEVALSDGNGNAIVNDSKAAQAIDGIRPVTVMARLSSRQQVDLVDSDDEHLPMSQKTISQSQGRRRQRRARHDDKNPGVDERPAAGASSKPGGKAQRNGARSAKVAAGGPDGCEAGTQGEHEEGGDQAPQEPLTSIAAAAVTVAPSKFPAAAEADADPSNDLVSNLSKPREKPGTAAAAAVTAPDESKPTAPVVTSSAIKATGKRKGGHTVNDGDGKAENAKRATTKAVEPGGRDPLAPQAGAGNVPTAKVLRPKGSMPPPPPPTAKVPKVAMPPPSFLGTQTTTVASKAAGSAGAVAVRKPDAAGRTEDFGDLTSDSEIEAPSESQDLTVMTSRANKRHTAGTEAAAPALSQMPAATKSGRFSLFKGMSMGMSMQTTTTDAGGGHEVSSGTRNGAGAHKKWPGNPTLKHPKAYGGAMDLFAGITPNK